MSRRCQRLLLIFILALSGVRAKAGAPAKYSNPELCTNEEYDGQYIGERLFLCDAANFGDADRAHKLYSNITFDRNADQEAERARYVTELYAFVKEVSHIYLTRREPKASASRIKQFGDDIMQVAYHESSLTHYAIGRDSNFKLMASDLQLVSRGLMQINQMFHSARDRDTSLDIYNNLMLGIDMIYNGEIAIDQKSARGELPCISKEQRQSKDYPGLRLRGSWSYYNGGGNYCRFTSNGPYQRYDDEFEQHLRHPDWRHYVTDPNKQIDVDIVCLENGGDLCALPLAPNNNMYNIQTALVRNQVSVFSDGVVCYTPWQKNAPSTCVDNSSMISCLGVPRGTKRANFVISTNFLANSQVQIMTDRANICAKNVPGLQNIGTFVQLKQDRNLYDEPTGMIIGHVKTGDVYQVIDFQILDQFTGERWYKVATSPTATAFFKAGTTADWQNFVQIVNLPSKKTSQIIPVTGNTIQVVSKVGLKIVATPGDGSLQTGKVPLGASLVVMSVQYKGSENQIYAEVQYQGIRGFVYVGQSELSTTIKQYIKIKADK